MAPLENLSQSPSDRVRLLDWRAEGPFLALVALGLLLLYALTMPRTVTFEDAGELISTAHVLGIAHPPGYPTYTMLGKLFSLLPFGAPATRVQALSSVAATVACLCVYALVIRSTGSRIAAIASAVLYGVSSTMWWMAIVAEVYALNAAFFFAVLLLCSRVSDGATPRLAGGLGLLFGLSLTNHWPLMAVVAPSFGIVLWPVRRELLALWKPLVAGVLLGLTPYSYILVASKAGPALAVYGPVETVAGLLAYIARPPAGAAPAPPTAGMSDNVAFVAEFGRRILSEFSEPVWAAIAAGFVASWIVLPRRIAWAMLWAFASSSVVLLFFVSFDFDPLRAELYRVYQLVPFGVAAVWIGSLAGYFVYGSWQSARVRQLVMASSVAAMIVSAVAANWTSNDMARDRAALDHAMAVLETMPPGAALFASVDTDIGQLTYARYVDDVRPDVSLYSEYGLMFALRLWDSRTEPFEAMVSAARGLLREEGRFFTTERGPLIERLADEVSLHDRGVYYEVTPKGGRPITSIGAVLPYARRYLDGHRPGGSSARWAYYRQEVAGKFCAALMLSGTAHPLLENNRYCRLRRASAALDAGHYREAAALYDAVLDEPPPVRKRQHHLLYNSYFFAVAKWAEREGGHAAHSAELRALAERVRPALEIYPACDNQVLANLLMLRTVVPLTLDWAAVADTFGECAEFSATLAKLNRS